MGVATGGHWLPLVPFTIATMALFCLRTPVESLLGTTPLKVQTEEERRKVLNMIVALGVVSAFALCNLLWRGRNIDLLAFGAVAGSAFGVQAVLKKIGRNWRLAAQIAGAAGLTITAPAAYYLATSKIDLLAVVLWIANWCFACDQIHFVQLRIHAARCNGLWERLARGRGFFVGQVVLAVAVALAWQHRIIPTVAALAFIPLVLRGFAWFFRRPQPLAVHKLGRDELTHAIVFGMLIIVGFAI